MKNDIVKKTLERLQCLKKEERKNEENEGNHIEKTIPDMKKMLKVFKRVGE